MVGKALKSEWSEVYLCYLEDEIVYVGSGKLNRHKHCNSGTSHVYELNKLHFEGVIFRGRDFYKSKGCAKLAHLLMNHRLTPTKSSIKFLSLLKESLEDFYEVEFEFKNLIKGVTHNIEL